ncbi:MAG: T9SS type A sorting domain-containing protein [Pirellulaceae bacterium]
MQIDHNHRIAAVVNNDPANRGSRAHSVLEILDATGEHVLAGSGNIAGAIGNGVTHPLPAGMYLVRIANNNSDGEGNYELRSSSM